MQNEIDVSGIINIATAAGEKILAYYGESKDALNVIEKHDKTLLTDADVAAHKVVVAGLTALTPEIPVLSEEGKHLPYQVRQQWQRYWLVDPLDGTRGFVAHCGEFTVNIALIEQHEPILGVLYVPVSGVCYYAVKAGRAYKLTSGKAEAIRSRRFDANDYRVLLGNAKHVNPVVEKIKALPGCVVQNVNSSLKFGLIAEGVADCYPRIGKTSEWDTAAAQVILAAAGGAVVDFSGRPLQYNAKSSLINPPFLAVGDPGAIPGLIKTIKQFKPDL